MNTRFVIRFGRVVKNFEKTSIDLSNVFHLQINSEIAIRHATSHTSAESAALDPGL